MSCLPYLGIRVGGILQLSPGEKKYERFVFERIPYLANYPSRVFPSFSVRKESHPPLPARCLFKLPGNWEIIFISQFWLIQVFSADLTT